MAKIMVFIEDGIVSGAYSDSADVSVEVVNYDKDFDSPDALDRLYGDASENLHKVNFCITHPGE